MARTARAGLHAKKKTLSASEQNPLERAAWRWQATLLLRPADLVFVDESGFYPLPAVVRTYGYAPRGLRCHGQVPRNRGRNTSILAALGPGGLVGTMTVEGSTNTDVFLTYLDQVLCPALRPGQTVVLDNLSVHKNEAVRQKIEAAGCRLWFLPAYSPDFNHIEHAFAELKRLLRKPKARTQEALEAAIAASLATITSQATRGWFKHCGFPLAVQSF